jgi:hypothetical protein
MKLAYRGRRAPVLVPLLHDQPPALLVAEIKFRMAAASAAFSSGASTVPRYCPRFLMIKMRQVRSLATVGFLGKTWREDTPTP